MPHSVNSLRFQGRLSPLRPWCISHPVSDFHSYFREIFRPCGKFSHFTFCWEIYWFSSAKISDFFSVIDHKFRISFYFPCFSNCPPVSRKLSFPPYFSKFPLCFRKIHLLFTCFVRISFPPYFDHDRSTNARTGRPCESLSSLRDRWNRRPIGPIITIIKYTCTWFNHFKWYPVIDIWIPYCSIGLYRLNSWE